MFKMIGGDGHEYGPVTAEQLREWITDHRANGQTLVQRDGTGDWQPVSAWPEFAEAVAAAWPQPPPAPPSAPPLLASPWDLEHDYDLDVGGCLGRGWQLVRDHFGGLVGASCLVWLLYMAASILLYGVGALLLAGPLFGGLMLLFLKRVRQQPAGLGDLFVPLGSAFLPLMWIWIVTSFLGDLGLLLFIVPGIYLKVVWAFSLTLAADRQLGFWPALEVSRRMVSRHWFKLAGLLTVAWLPVIVFSIYANVRTYEFLLDLFGGSAADVTFAALRGKFRELLEYAGRLGLQRELVVLLNLPFAYAALLYAYEDIFSPRRRQDD